MLRDITPFTVIGFLLNQFFAVLLILYMFMFVSSFSKWSGLR